MLKIHNFKSGLWQHLIVIVVLALTAVTYMSPMLDGLQVANGDVLQARGMRQELVEIYEKSGEINRWTTRNFSGMPADLLFGRYPSNIAKTIISFLGTNIHPQAGQLILVFISFYLAMLIMGYHYVYSAIAALVFGLSTHNMIFIDVGHTSKIQAIAMMAPLLTGVRVLFSGKYWLGAVVIALSFSHELAASHLQITYYGFILIFIMLLIEGYSAFRRKLQNQYAKALGILSIALIMGFLPNTSMIWSTYDYSKETIRGSAILETEKSSQNTGLKSDYANVFSHGIDDTFMLLIPGLKGGSGSEFLDENSETYKAFKSTGIWQDRLKEGGIQVPLYWGDQPISGGPVYFGVVVLVLFIGSLFIVTRQYRILVLSLVGTTFVIAWGRNMGVINDLLFSFVPFYSKFRAPSMVLGLTNILMIWSILEAVRELTINPDRWNISFDKVLKSTMGLGLVCLIFWWGASSFYTFSWEYGRDQLGFSLDENLLAQLQNSSSKKEDAAFVFQAIKDDRQNYLESDALRSLVIIVILSILLWSTRKYKVSTNVAVALTLSIAIYDLWSVDRRYLNQEDFVDKEDMISRYNLSAVDQVILNKERANDRMLDLTRSVFQDARPTYYHRTVGGNHGAKLRRYQDLIDHHLSEEINDIRSGKQPHIPALNMLNTRYIKYGIAEHEYFNNITSLGYAWFVNDINWVETADEELNAISSLNGAERAIIHTEFKPYFEDFVPSDLEYGKIDLVEYSPEKIVYNTHASTEQLVVFSEIWYKGNEYWKVSIDGEPASLIRANYVLRAMLVPAGSHEVIFEYKPVPYHLGEKISAFGSILLIGLTLVILFGNVWQKRQRAQLQSETNSTS